MARQQGFYSSKGGRVTLTFDNEGLGAVLENELIYVDQEGREHRCPVGMWTDGGSIPKIARPFLAKDNPFRSPWLRAFIVHDKYCYLADHLLENGEEEAACQMRRSGDILFLEILDFLGCDESQVFYAGVRTAGIMKFGVCDEDD